MVTHGPLIATGGIGIKNVDVVSTGGHWWSMACHLLNALGVNMSSHQNVKSTYVWLVIC